MYETELHQYGEMEGILFQPTNLLLEYPQTYLWLLVALPVLMALLIAVLELVEWRRNQGANKSVRSSIPRVAEAQNQITTTNPQYQ